MQNICRFCHQYAMSDRLVKYSTRHYAHHGCFLEAGHTLDELHAWQVGLFPYRVLALRGLLDVAKDLTTAV